ncbi:MAG: hypothetical protein KDC33_12220 [Thermoleophilia bacterium]|nr:hypothetical protein [Thermoleophilia bacterium]
MDLPPGAEAPVTVYVNGRQLTDGDGLRLEGTRIHFDEPLRARPELGLRHQILLAIGIGVYGDLKGDTLDVMYHRDGIPQMISDRRAKATGRPPEAA